MASRPPRTVNNALYADLGERWYEADDDPIALLRAAARLHAPWIAHELGARFVADGSRLLDVGCGAGLVANELARRGIAVVGVDLDASSLEVAARYDTTKRTTWIQADARSLPFEDASFDAVCAMDFLEHVRPFERVIAEVARVLRPGGRFFFHTFDRNLLSWLVVIKGMEWCVRNTPRDLHVLEMFIKPAELRDACTAHGLAMRELRGCEPRLSRAFFRMLFTGVVPADFELQFTRRPRTGYTGVCQRLAQVGGSMRANTAATTRSHRRRWNA